LGSFMRRDSRQRQRSWFQKSPQQPEIVVNGVTYGSPDEIPENLRLIWDRNIRSLEQRGIDWRAQRRIDLTWSHEGNVVSQRFSIEGASIRSPKQPVAVLQNAFFVYLAGWIALVIWAAVERPPLVFDVSNGMLLILLDLLYAPWVLMILSAYRKRQQLSRQLFAAQADAWASLQSRGNPVLDPAIPTWKAAGIALIALVATGLVTYLAVFGGVTRLLHHAERSPGETMAVVTAKYGSSSKRCAPRLELDGFRYTGNQVCVNRRLFDHVNVGDRIRITGMMSAYAMEPQRLEAVADD